MAEKMSKPSSDTEAVANSSPGLEAMDYTSYDEVRDHEYLSGFRLMMVLVSLTLATFLMLLDASIVATAIPKISSEFHSLDDIGWYGTAYLLANCVLQPLGGKIYSYFNVKITFLCFFTVFEIGSAICGAAQSSAMLIGGRAIAGLGASGLLNGGYTIVALVVEPSRQAALRGALMGLSFLGLLAGPLIGGAFTSNVHATWRWCFYLNLPCGALIALLILAVPFPSYRIAKDIPSSVFSRLRHLDIPGFLIFTPSIVMFILALQWGGTRNPWSSATIIGLFVGSFFAFLLFLAYSHYAGDKAMIPLALMARRVVWLSCLSMAFLIGNTMLISYYFPIWFQSVRAASPIQSGVDMLPILATNTVITMLTGALIGRVGYYKPFAIASAVLTSIAAGLISTLGPNSSTARRVGFQILQGGTGLGLQIPVIAIQNSISQEEVAVASAMVVFSQNLSAAVFLSLGEVIFSTELPKFLAQYAPRVDVEAVLAAGASAAGIAAAVPEDLLAGVREAYSATFTKVIYLALGAACGAFVVALGMKWQRIGPANKA